MKPPTNEIRRVNHRVFVYVWTNEDGVATDVRAYKKDLTGRIVDANGGHPNRIMEMYVEAPNPQRAPGIARARAKLILEAETKLVDLLWEKLKGLTPEEQDARIDAAFLAAG